MNLKPSLYIEESLISEKWIKKYLMENMHDRVTFVSSPNKSLVGINIFDKSHNSFQINHLNLQFSGVNLNLFSEKNESVIKFKTLEDFKLLIPSILKYLDKSIEKLTNDIIVISNTSYKNLSIDLYLKKYENIYFEILACSTFLELKTYIEKEYSSHLFKSISNLMDKDLASSIYMFEENASICLISIDKNYELDLILVKGIRDFLKKMNVTLKHKNSKDLSHIFTHLPYPVVILNIKTNAYNFNAEFSNLGINTKELSKYNDNQNIEVKNIGKMKIIKTKISEDFESISFIKIEDFEMKFSDQSQEELGIVSSSIAHELNNPLGGVLAALDVLLLDDNPSEIEEKFTQMKNGVQRCKELVETFLSFSRKKQIDSNSNLSFRQIFDQVIQLSRFRLVESNKQMKLDFTHIRANKYIKNAHLITMCLYLIVGELLTISSRDTLIKQTALSETLNLKVIEDIDSITIELENSYMLSEDFLRSKLFNYITDILKLKILERNKQKILKFY